MKQKFKTYLRKRLPITITLLLTSFILAIGISLFMLKESILAFLQFLITNIVLGTVLVIIEEMSQFIKFNIHQMEKEENRIEPEVKKTEEKQKNIENNHTLLEALKKERKSLKNTEHEIPIQYRKKK